MVNFLIYLFIANSHKGKKKKINLTSLLLLIKHILILSAYAHSTKYSAMTTLQEMEADTVYEHFRGNNSTGKRCLWVRFTTKERKLMTTATKRLHLWAESQVPWVGAIQLRAVEALEDTSRIILSFFVGETISDLEKVCFIFALIKFLIFSSFSAGLGSLTLVIWKKSLQSVIEKRVPAIHLKLQLNETLHKRHFSFPFYFFNL